MNNKKIIRYRIPISVKFPATHPRKGEQTFFAEGIKLSLSLKISYLFTKIHTIRGNYPLWEKRFKKINIGKAVIELYYWSGKPYHSKTITLCQLGVDDGIGLQMLYFLNGNIYDPIIDNDVEKSLAELSYNDGLNNHDFKDWFKGCDLSVPMAIIHFTPFRYAPC